MGFKEYQQNRGNRDRRDSRNNERGEFRGRGRNTTPPIDPKKIKTINAEALMQSQINNKVVEKMDIATPGGNTLEVVGNQLNLFTLTPRKPLIDCPYVQLKVSYEDITKKFGECITRVCTKGETLEMCQMSTRKLEEGECIGRKTPITSLEFYIVTGAFVKKNNDEGKEFRFCMFNKLTNVFTNIALKDSSDLEKATSLWNLYNAIKAGTVQTPSIPKPGNLLFYTLFSGEVTVTIETITGEVIKGVVKNYDLPTGHVPSLNLYVEGETGSVLRVISMYMVSTLIVHKYVIPDILSRRAFEFGMRGHVVIPHKGNSVIYDYCRRYRMDKDQEIKLDGNIVPYDVLNKHDTELLNLSRTIK
jgi:hypothetical protein